MNASTRSQLAEIEALLNRNLPSKAMGNLASLLRHLPYEELLLARPDIDVLVSRFLHKRQRELRSALEARLRGASRPSKYSATPTIPRRSGAGSAHVIPDDPNAKPLEYSVRLNLLRDKHIFRWSTAYRENINYIFKDLRLARRSREADDALLGRVSLLLEEHSTDIFQKGFNYITVTLGAATDVAIAKSIAGLQRFLFLAIDSYSAAGADVKSKDDILSVRAIASAMLSGVVRGYGAVRLGSVGGWDLLREYPAQWAHAIAFMTSGDLERVLDSAPESDFRTDLSELAVPCQLALDRVLYALPPHVRALPRVGRFAQYPLRFEVTVASAALAGRAAVKVTTFLGAPQTDPSLIQEAIDGGATAVVARIDADLWRTREANWSAKVIDATRVGQVDDLVDNVAERVGALLGAALADAPLALDEFALFSHNVASDFPLRDPIVRQFYLVQRHSVRQLLNTFGEGTGAHVWCSVRRSGKTTATIDLSGDTERSVVISQTMDHQPGRPDLNLFAARIIGVLDAGKPIDTGFFEKTVADCSLATSPARFRDARKVFIVDEYETLFGLLNAKAKQEEWVRYAVVLPLLSQMVAFSTANLLIFLGQRPDAHAIFMSQNQLSPLVRQDSFPLFGHLEGSTKSEFAEFLRNVLSGIELSPGFVDAVYLETSGHPYLTVNVMVDLCDWLIASRRPAASLRLEVADMQTFTRDRLSAAVLQRSSYYSTFQQMIADSLSEATREREPWLHAVTLVMQRICRQHPKALSCPEPKYREFAADAAGLVGTSPGQLLQAAKMANFLTEQAGQVRPSIRILGRLTAVAAPEVN